MNATCIALLLNIGMFKIKNRSLFQQIFIVYKPFTVGIRTKNLPSTTRFGLWLFYKGIL